MGDLMPAAVSRKSLRIFPIGVVFVNPGRGGCDDLRREDGSKASCVGSNSV